MKPSTLPLWRRPFTWVVLVLLAGCSTVPSLYNDAELAQMGIQSFQQMKEQATLSRNSEYNALVSRVGERIVAQVEGEIPHAQWEFVVFEDEAINAFVMPGGKVGVNTGLLKLVENEDQLAAVLGHEATHLLFDHANQRLSAATYREWGAAGLAILTDEYEVSNEAQALILGAYGFGTEVGGLLPFSRSHETEADLEGLKIAARAGYDPRAAVEFWRLVAGRGGDQPPALLSTHPSHGNRIERLQEAMPEALEIYRNNRR
ncbi:MAG: M48 family metallopeptidase [Opitutales bacterium]